ncbi:MAG: hypothetical protein ABIR30_13220 [Chitinophagaceae bacterium]
MRFPWQAKLVLSAAGIILLMLVLVSLFDILLVFFYSRFYSQLLFIVTFGVGGVFATVFAYMSPIKLAPVKNEMARWLLLGTIIISGLLFFFLFSRLEGGEYGPAFKAFGLTMVLSSFLFVKGNVDV